MIAWANVSILTAAIGLLVLYHLRRTYTDPAPHDRAVFAVLMTVPFFNYIFYRFYPLPFGLPVDFSWGWMVSMVIGLIAATIGCALMLRGMVVRGEEIRNAEQIAHDRVRIRRRQISGEIVLWWSFAFLLNSPFLVLFSAMWLLAIVGLYFLKFRKSAYMFRVLRGRAHAH
jgi:hypothetical protein